MTVRPETICLLGGTGLTRHFETLLEDPRVSRNLTLDLGSGPGEVLYCVEGRYRGMRVIVLPRHGPSHRRPDRSPAELIHHRGHEAHIWYLHSQGVGAVYAFSAVGTLDRELALASDGSFVVPDRFARGFGATVHSFGERAKDVHPNMSAPFSAPLRRQLLGAIAAAGATAVADGLYISSGPDQFESAVEIRALDRLFTGERNRLVGMTVGPELVLARQMEIPYAVLCSVANLAEGIGPPVSHARVLEVMEAASRHLLRIAERLLDLVAGA